MRRRFTLPALTVGVTVASLLVAVSPASAHGYISSPPSRQANCASGAVANCGDIIYEPQSVEAPKGAMTCSGGSGFTVLDNDSKGWKVSNVASSTTFIATSGVALPIVGWYSPMIVSAFALHSVKTFCTNVSMVVGDSDR